MKYDVSDSAIVLPLSNNRTCEDDRISQYWITVNGSVIRVMQGNYGAQWRINVDFNSLRSGDTYIRQRSGSSLVQVIAWRLFGAKLLPEPMMTYRFDPQEQISLKLESVYKFHWRKRIWKCLQTGPNVLMHNFWGVQISWYCREKFWSIL